MAGPLADRLARRLTPRLLRWTNRAGDFFTTTHSRPKYHRHTGVWPDPDVHVADTAIVMQGPVATNADFTCETLRLYAEWMPGCRLILSTWDDTPRAQLAPIEALGAEIVLSPRPAVAGPFNVNMQLVSAAAGMRAAVAGGAEWLLKTRTDQRLGERNALAYLRTLARSFPPAAGTGQRARLLGVGLGSLKFAPYHVTDQTLFGHAEDMLAYWSAPLRTASLPGHWPDTAARIFATVPIGELSRHGAAESYICASFLETMGERPDWTLADSWRVYRDRFCFTDQAMTDFFWEKGQTISQREHTRRYDMVSNRLEMGLGEWLLLHDGTIPPAAAARYAHVLDQRFNEAVPRPGAD